VGEARRFWRFMIDGPRSERSQDKEDPMTTPQIWYVNVFVRDLRRAVAFFRDALGLPLQFEDEKFGYASFAPPGVRLGIARVDPNAPETGEMVGRHTGVGFGVADLDAAHRELAARGVRFPMPPSKQPWGGYLATFADPDGNIFYLDQLRAE
jgi:predicted enzyme related to lactoylglutathione lyase